MKLIQHPQIEPTNPLIAVSFDSGPYEDVIFRLGSVKFVEKGDTLSFQYNYDVLFGAEYVDEHFKKYLGDFLFEMIEDDIGNYKLVYKGGIDG